MGIEEMSPNKTLRHCHGSPLTGSPNSGYAIRSHWSLTQILTSLGLRIPASRYMES